MPETSWLKGTSPAFRLMIATSWLAPASLREQQEEVIREAVGRGLDWIEYLRLVNRHRIPALSWAALRRVPGLEIPVSAKQELQKRSDACRMQAVKHSMLLAGVLGSFNRAAIPVMTFKGPTLSSELYGDVGLRHSRDLDLGVTPEDLPRAQDCLESMGWQLGSTWFPLSPRQWESLLLHERHLCFVHAQGGSQLELHWRNKWDPPNAAAGYWARSTASVWQGCCYQAMNPIDQVIYLSAHGADHAWFRAKWLGDLARLHSLGRVDWAAVLDRTRRNSQDRALLVVLRLLNEAYGVPLPSMPGDLWRRLPTHLVEVPLRALKSLEEPPTRASVALVRYRIRMTRYRRLLLPRMPWRDGLAELTYSREDFGRLRLPDSLFWAYAPLHPVLWLLRWARRGMPLRD